MKFAIDYLKLTKKPEEKFTRPERETVAIILPPVDPKLTDMGLNFVRNNLQWFKPAQQEVIRRIMKI